jgi:hypothetical protein
MLPNADVAGLQSQAELRLAALRQDKLVSRIAVLSTSLGAGKVTQRLRMTAQIVTFAPGSRQQGTSDEEIHSRYDVHGS